MIPVRLTIQGLYSYRQRQTIEFDNLTSAKLFGLFGGVGSGKSTILEAISFALYGESERLNRNDNRNYNMMNLKSNELFIDFEFKTGTADRYRFTVSGRRNGKRFDDVKTFERAAYRCDGGQWLPLPDTTAEKVTGLSYDNFRRTIIIPQGKFQEFLQLNPKERTSMLMELFGLERFELSGKVGNLEIHNNEQMQHLKGQLATLGNIEPSQIEQLHHQQIALAAELKQLGEDVGRMQKEVVQFEKAKELQHKLQIQQQRAEALEMQEKEIQKLERGLSEYEQTVMTFQSDLELLRTLVSKRNEADAQLKADHEKFAIDNAKRTDVQAVFEKLKTDFDQREQWLKQADELEKLAQITGFDTKCKELAVRNKNGTKLLIEKTEYLAAVKLNILQLKETIAQTRQTMPDIVVLTQVKQWFTVQSSFIKSQNDIQQRIDQYQASLASLQSEALALTKTFSPNLSSDARIDQCQDLLAGQKEEVKKQLAQLQQKNTQVEVNLRLQTFANDLADGMPCPLCGSTHHPQVYSTTHAAGEMAQLNVQLAHADTRLSQLESTQKQLVQWATLFHSHEKLLTDAKQQLIDTQALLAQHTAAFVWSAYAPSNPQLVDEHFTYAQQTAKQLELQTKQVDELERTIAKEEAEKEKYAKALELIDRDRLALTTQINTLSSQIIVLKPEDYSSLSAADIAGKASILRKQHEETGYRFNTTDKQLQTLTQAIHLLKGKIDANQKSFDLLVLEIAALTQRIDQKLKDAQLPSRQHVEAVLQQKPDVAAGRQRIDQWHRDTAATRELLATLRADLQGSTYNEAAHKQASIHLADAIDTGNRMNQSIGDIVNQIKRLENDLARQAQLNVALDKLQLRAANLTELKNMFRSSGFVNYVSTVYLQNLCAAANERFYRLTRQHLSLELADDNTFQIRDFMNEGKTRSVKTLSGGQTFQASLSLALALADSVRHLSSGAENFFFLDEGFGTLDRESLGTVFDTLTGLRHENRIVGVISHVDEMQQEIQTYLRITNSEESGSVVRGSWEG
ncbi:MAG: AAA family ATPase [Breznakibacter sp.]